MFFTETLFIVTTFLDDKLFQNSSSEPFRTWNFEFQALNVDRLWRFFYNPHCRVSFRRKYDT